MQKIAVMGDLVAPAALHFWSELTLVVWGMGAEHQRLSQALKAHIPTPRFTLVDAHTKASYLQKAIRNERPS